MTSQGITRKFLFTISTFITITSFLHHHVVAAATLPPRTDASALLSFKSLLSDPNGALISWKNNKSTHHCTWYGVTCGSTGGVTSLDLAGHGLTGLISSSIANLTHLSKLNLAANNLHGTIPGDLGHLSQLQYLNLSTNNLQGELPDNLSHCFKLETIALGRNSLVGAVPSIFASFKKLKVLDLASNNLTGDVPLSLANCSTLEVLSLSDNRLTGNIPLLSSKLVHIDLSYNALTGNIPDYMGNISSLRFLNLEKNNLSGRIPPFERSESLVYLILSSNQLSGSIPPSIGNLSSLYKICFFENKLVGEIPRSIGNIAGLAELDMDYNELSGTIPQDHPIYNLSSLTVFSLYNNKLHGILPPDLGLTLPNLKNLSLGANEFSGNVPITLSNATGLQMIDLVDNLFTGFMPPNLGSLKNLTFLSLGENNIQSNDLNFINSLTNCSLLEVLYLHSNKLEGTIPTSVGNLSKQLRWLMLGMNKIRGTIPAEIGKLVGLGRLYLNNNNLTGSIPSTIGKLRKLHQLRLSNNELTGIIPSSVGNLSQLNYLYMDQNKLSGRIPPTIGNCMFLQRLNLSYNALTGVIPVELTSISSLTEFLDLSHNLLHGSLPMEVKFLVNLVSFNVSDNRLSGEIPNLGSCVLLESLIMKGNFFSGSIPKYFVYLKGLIVLDLSNNKLNGSIPDFFKDFHSLHYLNLSFNELQGEVPSGGIFQHANETFMAGNKKLCGGAPSLHLPQCFVSRGFRKHTLQILIPAVVSSLILVFLLVIIYRQVKFLRQSKHKDCIEENHTKIFSYTDLLKATDGFCSNNLIGSGSFGSVYKAKMLPDEDLAVKVLDLDQRGALKSFIAECEALRNIRHRNILRIITTCSSLDARGNEFVALIFRYMPNGSLDQWLHQKEDSRLSHNLSFKQRLKIALDVASAMAYLHNDCDIPIIHCDLKPSNILLDDDMAARVADFGIAKFLCSSLSSASSMSTGFMGIKGSIGYIAPEYGMGSKVSTQGDVYSYGILLLEMMTGRRPTDKMFNDDLTLHEYVKTAFPDKIMEVLDPGMLLRVEEGQPTATYGDKTTTETRIISCMISLIVIGISCSSKSPEERMQMNNVAAQLHSIKTMCSNHS